MAQQLDRIEQMLRALCAHLGVRERDLEQMVTSTNGADSAVGDGRRYMGVVSRFEHGWGFIECEAMNRNFFVHYSDIEGTGLRSLEAGEGVSFEIAPGKDGRPKAVKVKRHGSARSAQRPARIEAIPRRAPIAYTNGDEAMDTEEDADEQDMPQPTGPTLP